MAQQNVIDEANQQIANLTAEGAFEETQAVADNATQTLQQIIQENQRVEGAQTGAYQFGVGQSNYEQGVKTDADRYAKDQETLANNTAYQRDLDEINRQDRLDQQAIENALNNKQITMQEAAVRRANLESDRNYKLDVIQTNYASGKPSPEANCPDPGW